MLKHFTYLLLALVILACNPEDSIDTDPSFVTSEFVNGHFTYVDGFNKFGVPAEHWAGQSTISMYMAGRSDSGKPQGKIVWEFGDSQKTINAWWRLDESQQKLAIFGANGTASFLGLADDHFVFDQKWLPISINEDGHIYFKECMNDCNQWEFKRQSTAGTWIKD